MSHPTLTKFTLSQFTGTEHWYRHPFLRHVLYTDGVRYVAEAGGAYWLIDEIALAQTRNKIATQPFQLWKLTVHADHSATLACEDGNGNQVWQKQLTFTDFPLDSISFYVTDDVILLPNEY